MISAAVTTLEVTSKWLILDYGQLISTYLIEWIMREWLAGKGMD